MLVADKCLQSLLHNMIACDFVTELLAFIWQQLSNAKNVFHTPEKPKVIFPILFYILELF